MQNKIGNTETQPNIFFTLPLDIVIEIFSYLQPIELYALMRVSSNTKVLADNNRLWSLKLDGLKSKADRNRTYLSYAKPTETLFSDTNINFKDECRRELATQEYASFKELVNKFFYHGNFNSTLLGYYFQNARTRRNSFYQILQPLISLTPEKFTVKERDILLGAFVFKKHELENRQVIDQTRREYAEINNLLKKYALSPEKTQKNLIAFQNHIENLDSEILNQTVWGTNKALIDMIQNTAKNLAEQVKLNYTHDSDCRLYSESP